MSLLKKKRSFIDEQLEVVEAQIRNQKVGTIEYERWLKIRDELVQQKDHEKRKPVDVKGIITDIVIPVGTTAVSTGLSLYLAHKYESVAKMAYGLDDDFKFCNGRAWAIKDKIASLIPKK